MVKRWAVARRRSGRAAFAVGVASLGLSSACGPSYEEPSYAAPGATLERDVRDYCENREITRASHPFQ